MSLRASVRMTAAKPARASVGALAADSREGEALYREIVENALVVTGARFVNLSWIDEAERTIVGSAWAGAPASVMERAIDMARAVMPGFDALSVRFRIDMNPANRRVLIEGVSLLAPFEEHAEGTVHPAILAIAQRVLGLRWTHSVPLRVDGRVAGALAFHWSERPEEATQRAAEAFSRQVTLTVENARLSAALRERAAESERSRERIVTTEERTRQEIAEFLHSRVQGRLLLVTHRLWETVALLQRDPDRARLTIEEVARELDRIREEDIRQVSHRLHPAVIQIGLVAALEQLVDGFGAGLEVTLSVTDEVRQLDHPLSRALPETVRLGVYRIVEEALGNVVRHAGAEAAFVTLAVHQDGRGRSLVVSVRDDGRGFDRATLRTGMGLRRIQDRAEQMGAAWTIQSRPGAGALLSVHVLLTAIG